jgi:hypothetical protein
MKGKVSKYNRVTIKTDFYITQQETPERSIGEIMEAIKGLGGIPEIIGTKLVDEMTEKKGGEEK